MKKHLLILIVLASSLVTQVSIADSFPGFFDCGFMVYNTEDNYQLSPLENEMCGDLLLSEETYDEMLNDEILLGKEIEWLYDQIGRLTPSTVRRLKLNVKKHRSQHSHHKK